jgi:hypothetical protein
MDYSASRAEIGDNAGADTWRAACDDAPDYPLLDTKEKRDAFRRHMRDMGFSEANDMRDWNNLECNALYLQLIAGDIREAGLDNADPDWEAYEADENNRGSLFRGDDGEIYYYLGS